MKILSITIICAFLLGAIEAQAPPQSLCTGRPAGTILPDYTDCNHFFRCPGGTGQPARGRCDPGRFFDPPTGECLPAAQANCFRCPVDAPFEELPVRGLACNQFIRCINNTAQHLDCAPGLMFDRRLSTCNLSNLVSCPNFQCPAVDDPNNRLWVRDPQNCGSFFVCVRGEAVSRSCPPNLQFNTATRQCDHEHTVQCRV